MSCNCEKKCNCNGLPASVDMVTSETECVTLFQRFKQSCCFSVIDSAINIFCALKDIAAAIREAIEISDAANSGFLQFYYLSDLQYSGSGTLSTVLAEGLTCKIDGVSRNNVLLKTQFPCKVLGFGVAGTMPTSLGASNSDDILSFKLFFYNSVTSTDWIQLTRATVGGYNKIIFDNPIGVSPGEEIIIHINYSSTDAGNFVTPPIHLSLFIQPELS